MKTLVFSRNNEIKSVNVPFSYVTETLLYYINAGWTCVDEYVLHQ